MIPVDWKSVFEPAHVTTAIPGSDHGTAFGNTRNVRIEWGDCDPAGIIFYPRYFEIFDASTSALFERACGMTKLQLLKTFDFAGFPLARTRAKFMRPTRFGDDVTVDTRVTVSRSSFSIEHRLSRSGETCVECSETRVWAVRDRTTGAIKSHPIPAAVLAKFNLSPLP